jgi:ATP-dependent Clp protease ATP-binding subunit ClpB
MDILLRSVMGLTGAQVRATGGRPRGVLFFAGPTGVGKTELAKALTGVLFGDERSYVRFDMSEFSEEHAAARLLGAPPGYVGYEAGGELTNALRRRPFSVVLFDEIEKCHPRLLDKFLQILEDGRLTDGQGNTVYFSECVIIFTSNLGTVVEREDGRREQNVTAADSYDVVEERIRKAIEEHFKFRLGRPELLNRIGDNIVVFNFISRVVGEEILAGMLRNVARRIKSEHDLDLQLSAPARAYLSERCLSDLTNGGRGIGNRLESVLINPIARALFDRQGKASGAVLVTEISESAGVFSVALA